MTRNETILSTLDWAARNHGRELTMSLGADFAVWVGEHYPDGDAHLPTVYPQWVQDRGLVYGDDAVLRSPVGESCNVCGRPLDEFNRCPELRYHNAEVS